MHGIEPDEAEVYIGEHFFDEEGDGLVHLITEGETVQHGMVRLMTPHSTAWFEPNERVTTTAAPVNCFACIESGRAE